MKERIGIDFFTKLLYPSRLQERDGVFYFVGTRATVEDDKYLRDLYCLREGQAYPLTGSHDVRSYALLDEGIVFASLRERKDREAVEKGTPLTVFYLLPYGGGEAREYLRLPYSISQALWLKDGGLLFRAAYDPRLQGLLLEHDGDMQKALAVQKEQDDMVTVLEELPFWFNGEGFLGAKRTALFLYDGENTAMLTPPLANVGHVKLNADRTKALFTQQLYEHVAPEGNTLHLLDIQTRTLRQLENIGEGEVEDYAFVTDEEIVYLHIAADAPYGRVASNAALHRYTLMDGADTLLDDSGTYNYYNSVGSDAKQGNVDDGLAVRDGQVTFLCTLLHHSHLLRFDLASGAFSQVTTVPGAVLERVPYGSGYAVLAMRGDEIADVYAVSPDGGETRLSDLNGDVMRAHEVVTPVELSFTNKEGTTIHGWVMPPVDYVPGMVYPAILNIHGGPKTAYGSIFFHEMQYWCAQGFAVLFCNPTGGDGQGSAFADIRGKYGTVDYADIMQFADEATKRFGFISAVRIGVTGGSYGGFMTNWIIGHTDRFRAAASQRSISNWTGFATTSDIGHTFGKDQMQGTPWTNNKALWSMSPLKYADKVKTPTLFIHSDEDYRCNMFEGIQMYYALRSMGVTTRLCLFKGENHELSRSGKPKSRIRRLHEITRWMEKYLV